MPCLENEPQLNFISNNRIKVGRSGKKREKHFLLPTQEMGVKTQNGGPYL
jgi:hypothetical protein